MPNLEQTEQALLKLEEVREMIREAEVDLRESAYYPPPEARHYLSEAASGLSVAEQTLWSVLKVLRTTGRNTARSVLSRGTEEGKEQLSIFPTRILLATDGSEEAELALRMAVELASSTNSELHVLSVGMPDFPDYVELLEEAYRKFERHDQQIVHFAERLDAGMIVMGSRGLSPIKRALMGSVSDSVVRHAHCPVLVVRGEENGEALFSSKRILLATDGSEEAELAARAAADIAQKTASELHAVHVGIQYFLLVHDYMSPLQYERLKQECREVLDGEVKKVEAMGGIVAQAHLRMGLRADEEIVKLAEELEVDLIVLGSRGLGSIRRALMGDVSNSVVRHAHCPVLVVRKDEKPACLSAA